MGCRKSTPFLIDMGASVDQILALVGKQAPVALAYAWDRVGLLIGSPRQEVKKLVVALEATEAVLRGAVAMGPAPSAASPVTPKRPSPSKT